MVLGYGIICGIIYHIRHLTSRREGVPNLGNKPTSKGFREITKPPASRLRHHT